MGNEAKRWEMRQKDGSFPLIREETQEAVLCGLLGSLTSPGRAVW